MFRRESAREVTHWIVYGLVGLGFGWFGMGFTSWTEVGPPFLVVGFQLGMFCFWSTVAFAPRLFLGERESQRKVSRQILWFYVPYFAVVYTVGLSVPTEMRFGTIIVLIVIGHYILNLFFVKYLMQSF